jgi:hypothetical protein
LASARCLSYAPQFKEKMATKADVYAALMRKGAYEVVQEQESVAQLRLMGRSPLNSWSFFFLMINHIIEVADAPQSPWTCDVSKKYFNRNGSTLYGWRFIFQAPRLADHYAAIVSTILSAPQPTRPEVTTMLLPGYKEGDVRGGVNAKGKGSSSAGSLPMAVTRGAR